MALMRYEQANRKIAMLKSHYSRFIILFIVLFGGLLALESYTAFRHFQMYQQQLSRKTVNSLAQEISILIDNLGRKTYLFSQDKSALLQSLYTKPEQPALHQYLQTQVKTWFPEAYSFALATLQGQSLLPGTQHLSNSACFAELENLGAKAGAYQIMLHKGANEKLHFDVLTAFQMEEKLAVFFISVPLDPLLRLLRNGQTPGHGLELLDTDKHIKIMLPKFNANMDNWQQTHAAVKQIPDTAWQLSDWPQPSLYQNKIRELSARAALMFICFAVVGWLLWQTLMKAERAGGRTFQVLSGIEQERRRIAMEMHDQVLAELSHIGRDLGSLAQNMDVPVQRRLQQMEEELGELSSGIRNIIDDLHPQALEMLGLESALRLYLEKRFASEDAPNYDLEMQGELCTQLSPEQALGLYRVILEAINNSLKHANCQHCHISIQQQQNSLLVSVEDDGKGLDLRQARDSSSRGLANISTRSRMLDARVQWSKPQHFEQGTRFELRMHLALKGML